MFSNLEQSFYIFMGFLPFFLVVFLWNTLRRDFFDWREDLFYLKQDRILLEIKIPKEVSKTPLAMELIFQSLYNPSGEGNWWKKKYKGKRRPRFSIEIASDGGKVRFYIYTEVKYKQGIENIFYSQYPTVEIVEVPDYVKFVEYNPDRDYLMGCEFGKSKEDPFPIKTYEKFGLDKPGLKPEEIQDPISSILGAMGSIGPEDQMWLQIIFRAQKKDKEIRLSFLEKIKNRMKSGSWNKSYDWRSEAEDIIKELKSAEDQEDKDGKIQLGRLTKKQTDSIDDIVENINKPAFWVTMRYIYKTSDKESFNKHAYSMFSFFPTTGSVNANIIRPSFETNFKNPWDDYNGKRLEKMKVDIFGDYKRRKMETDWKKYFTWGAYKLIKYKQMRLSTTELATIFHLPFSMVSPPTLERSKFKKAEAPINLPT